MPLSLAAPHATIDQCTAVIQRSQADDRACTFRILRAPSLLAVVPQTLDQSKDVEETPAARYDRAVAERFTPVPAEAVGSAITPDEFSRFLDELPDDPTSLMEADEIAVKERRRGDDDWGLLLGVGAALGALALALVAAIAKARSKDVDEILDRNRREGLARADATRRWASRDGPESKRVSTTGAGGRASQLLSDIEGQIARDASNRTAARSTPAVTSGRPRGAGTISRSVGTLAVADTNSFISDLRIAREMIDQSPGGSVRIVLPATVVSELDGLQYASDGELAYRARSALSMLEGCVGGGNLRWLRRERAAQGKGAGMPYLVAGDRKGEWVQGVAQETKPAADSMWWDKDRDGDKEVLGLCLALRAPAAAKTQKGSTRWGALGVVGGGERGEVGEKHGRAPTRVVLLTADKALQVSAMLEGVRTMAIEQWASREVQ